MPHYQRPVPRFLSLTILLAGLIALALVALAPASEAGMVKTVASFNGSKSKGPKSGLTNVGGRLYGTTTGGGSTGYGTLFSYDPSSGRLTTLAGFTKSMHPFASLAAVGGTLYGTTYEGGRANHGTLFSYKPNGHRTTQASFTKGADPLSSLVDVGGMLYGTTAYGGRMNAGTLFSYKPSSGRLKTLVSFIGPNGKNPDGLIDVRYSHSWCMNELESDGVSGWNGSTRNQPAMRDTPWTTIPMNSRQNQQPRLTTHSLSCCVVVPAT